MSPSFQLAEDPQWHFVNFLSSDSSRDRVASSSWSTATCGFPSGNTKRTKMCCFSAGGKALYELTEELMRGDSCWVSGCVGRSRKYSCSRWRRRFVMKDHLISSAWTDCLCVVNNPVSSGLLLSTDAPSGFSSSAYSCWESTRLKQQKLETLSWFSFTYLTWIRWNVCVCDPVRCLSHLVMYISLFWLV